MSGIIFIGGLLGWITGFLIAISLFGNSTRHIGIIFIAAIVVVWGFQATALARLDECILSGIEWVKAVFLLSPNCPIHFGNAEPFHAMGFTIRRYLPLAFLIIAAIRTVFALKSLRKI
ncbi:hypothetical protein D1822_01785 [Phaeobacter inhibens]|nr:hypothetical protein PGA1_c03620 [Phaeobacter inhibens DSM 17395]AXT21639.1 hypothetical protein D1822_01785 [Phaeobacter inhibens]